MVGQPNWNGRSEVQFLHSTPHFFEPPFAARGGEVERVVPSTRARFDMYEVQHIDRPGDAGNITAYGVYSDGELIAEFPGPLGQIRAEDYVAWMQRDDLEIEGGE